MAINVGGYTLNQVGPQIDPRYPIYRPDTTPEISRGSSYDQQYRGFLDDFAGGILRGFQNIPKQAPSYAAMPGTAEYQAAQGQLALAMQGLLPDLQNQPSGLLSGGPTAQSPFGGMQVVPIEPSGVYTATPTDPNAPPPDTGTQTPEHTGLDAWIAMNVNSMLHGHDAGGYDSQASNLLTGFGLQWDDMDDAQKRGTAAAIAQTVSNPSDLDTFMNALSGPATEENLRLLGVTASGNMGQIGDMERKLAQQNFRNSSSQRR